MRLLGLPSALRLPQNSSKATISIRPEDVQIVAPAADLPRGRVTFIRDLGGAIDYFVDVDGVEVVAVTSPRARPVVQVGDTVGIHLDPASCVVLTQ